MPIRSRTVTLAATVLVLAGATSGSAAAATPGGEVRLSVAQPALDLPALPCLGARVDATVQNLSSRPTYVDVLVTADAPLELPRRVLSTYLPAGYAGSLPVQVVAPAGTPAGDYELELRLDRQRVAVPVTVTAPHDGPQGNLALGERTAVSSVYTGFRACGPVDGDRDPAHWGTGSGWNDATLQQFPDTFEVRLGAPTRVGRVDVYTLTPGSLRDYDVQALVDGGWHTVDEVRGATCFLSASFFTPTVTDGLRIVVHAVNGVDDYSRILELEAYPDGMGAGRPPPGVCSCGVRTGAAGSPANLALDGLAIASSTHPSSGFAPCNAIDGNRDPAGWPGTGWNDNTVAQYPDWLEVRWAQPRTVGRAYLTTLPSGGIRDYDVQAAAGEGWQTVAQVRGNTAAAVESTFEPVQTSAVRVLVNASNVIPVGNHARIVELELYRS
jgi:hypothetical protein